MSPDEIWNTGGVWLVWCQTRQTDGVLLMTSHRWRESIDPHLQGLWSWLDIRIDVVWGRVIMVHIGLSHSMTPRHFLVDLFPLSHTRASSSPLRSLPLTVVAQWTLSLSIFSNSWKVKSRSKFPSGHPSQSSVPIKLVFETSGLGRDGITEGVSPGCTTGKNLPSGMRLYSGSSFVRPGSFAFSKIFPSDFCAEKMLIFSRIMSSE